MATPTSDRASRGLDPAVPLVILVLGGYLLLARVVGDFYPFSTFSMYAENHSDSASHVLARDANGVVRDVGDYAAWSCPEAIDLDPPSCRVKGDVGSIGYVDRQVEEQVSASHGGVTNGEPVDLVRRIWRFGASSGETRVEDCLLARCQARR